ncbi:tetratricopeptide repeat protein [uncultured Erythrobacter sp.]|uniref:tetratricopeptide repeat protein n=1 Tax=uncultured Erythrobacter sp. TaxID=263913 RepID=UPI002604C528|nr:tetratricopeptide repeat protein [uncultured Erythrobacter sp.]
MTRSLTPVFGSAFVASLALLSSPTVHAQNSTSREVVQPLPSSEVQRLNRALLELARSPRSVPALLEAGDASLAVQDLDAAIGFYGSAAELDPSDSRIKLGLARVYLRSGRPVEALPLLEEAQNAGAARSDVLGPRALAYDLVGDQEAAQSAYAAALELSPQDDELRRRLAISQAISGNSAGFQETLAPLLEARDVAAFRARAFGLAILGEQERAEGIVNSVMPPDLAARINPYLAYMPRLTPAQQAAAANLGIFPRAADIGREDPRIARFAREGASGSLLEPVGEPLGAPVSEVPPEPTQTVQDASLPQVATRETGQPTGAAAPETSSTQPSSSVVDAFADLSGAEMPEAGRPQDAVNIAELDVPREAAPEPAEPEHPRRIWVQLATGRDVDALGFDWRRFSRRAPDLLGAFEPHVTPWGQANRLLAGPLENNREARRLVNALSEKGIETFTFTSPEGTEIKVLN